MPTTTSERAMRRLATAALIMLALVVSLVGPAAPATAFTQSPATVFINEIHYDNVGTDSGEAIEIAGPAGTSLTGWSIVRYNGANGQVYTTPAATETFSGSLPDQGGGYGTAVITYPANGLQNGNPDAVALVNSGTVVQFLSYGGTFVAVGGAANGLTSTDIGVSEGSATPVGTSLQLTGTGTTYQGFTWAPSSASSFGAFNAGQTFETANQPIAATATPASITTDQGVAASSALSAVDPDGRVSGASITAGGVAGITLDGFAEALAVGGTATATLNVANTVAPGTYNVVITFTNGDDPSQSTPLTVPVTVIAAAVTPIHAIQGAGGAVTGPGPFTVEAIVVGDYQTQGSGQLRGFFLQEEDADADADPATSEGIFVFCTTCPVDVQVGDLVRVSGGASEFFNMSQLTASTVASVTVLDSGQPLPTPAAPTLPVPGVPTGDLLAARAAINAYLEQFEGMLVRFDTELKVAEYFELARYGQVVLAAGERPRQFTDVALPSVSGFVDHTIDFASRTIILDDDNNVQNDAVTGIDTPFYHPVPGLSTTNFFRGGDTITGLTGVLHWSFAGQAGTDAWRIRPVVEEFSYAFTSVNERPTAPELGGSLKVAAYNVLNYFLTVDTTPSNNTGTCSPTLTADCRGADSDAELARQREKLTQALLGLDADVLGLIEMENTPGVNPSQAIVQDLNAAGPDNYGFIDTGVTGSDAIRVGIIYKTGSVQPVGDVAVLDSQAFVNPLGADLDRNRPAVAQTFEETATGARFTVVVNHLKSKGSACGAADPDLLDGQGNCNLTRTMAVQALLEWLATYPTGSADPDVMIVGDLNAYRNEDPVRALEAAGYVDLIESYLGAEAYSYLFGGQLGYLDHALASPSLAAQVVDVEEWHINADEVPLFDYNDTVQDPGEAGFERESTALPIYEANAYRTSDHDPAVAGLSLTPLYRARQVGSNVWIERNIAEAGLGDVDGSPVDGWALVGRTNGANERGELRGFFVQSGVPYAIVFNSKANGCILVTPASLNPVGPGNGRTTVIAPDPAPYCPAP